MMGHAVARCLQFMRMARRQEFTQSPPELEQFSKSRGALWLADAMEYGFLNLPRSHKSA